MTGAPTTAPFVRHHRRYDDWFEFVDDAKAMRRVARRVFRPGRELVIGLIDTLSKVREIEPVGSGTGRGAFLTVRARRQ